jgi:dextranase
MVRLLISMKMIYYTLLFLLLSIGCKKNPTADPYTPGITSVANFFTDKAVYTPGSIVQFTLDKDIPAGAKIRYRKLGQTLSEIPFTSKTWQWMAPAADFTGYMVDVYTMENGQEKVQASIGVDVSSDYNRFPRNGFLSSYGVKNTTEINQVISQLNRYHINVIQFYDWHYKHHMPLAGSATDPSSQWKDIANRDTYLSTVKGYINAAHTFNMKTLFYNLAYGSLNDAASDGVSSEWYFYKDANHTSRDVLQLPSPQFKSSIYIMDPSNANWQQYLAGKNKDVYTALNFDGYQVDQLGDRGTLYNFPGTNVSMASTFNPFLQSMKAASPNKSLVMNAVNQYGQQGIAQAPVDFLYTEVWGPHDGYTDLSSIIRYNDGLTNNSKKTVLTAYMDYDLANNPGYFNTPGVLLTDAVIFSFGGSHLELGEHMLGKEYFPNNNLQMKSDLSSSITSYYDFLVGYENLLRDGGSFNTPSVSCANGKMTINSWPPRLGQVSVVGKAFPNKQVLNFINFSNANSLNWRDANGTQALPITITDSKINFSAPQTVSKIWMATPDDKGVANSLPFTQNGNAVSFTLPALQYWDMVVVEYQ